MAPPVPSRRQRYLTVIVRATLTATLAFLLAEVAGRYFADNFLPTSYTATSEIQIRPEALVEIRGVSTDARQEGEFEAAFKAKIDRLKSPELLLPIIQDLGLDQAWANRLSGQNDAKALSSAEALDHLRKILKIEPIPHTNIIKISVTSEVPKETADIANAIADRYKTMRDAEEEQRFRRGDDALSDQIAKQQKMVDEKNALVEKSRQDLSSRGITAGNDGDSSNADNALKPFRDAQRDLDKNQAMLDALQVRLQQDKAEMSLQVSPVRILSRAQPPTHPNHHIAHMMTHLIAVIFAITAASFVEMIMLFRRAGERE